MQNRLKELRDLKKISQRGMSKIIKRTQPTYCDWENGNTQPDIESLIVLANFFDCSIDYLVGRESEEGNIIMCTADVELRTDEKQLLAIYNKLPTDYQSQTRGFMRRLQEEAEQKQGIAERLKRKA